MDVYDNGEETGGSDDGGMLEGRSEVISGEFNEQDVTNTLWVYATMGRNRMEVRGSGHGSTGGEDGGDIRGVQIVDCYKHVMGVFDKGEEFGRRGIGVMGLVEWWSETISGKFNEKTVTQMMFVYATMGRKFPTKTNTKLIYLNFVPCNIFWVFRHDDIRHVLCSTMTDSFCIIISFEKDEGEGPRCR